mmetsp:Transcript_8927/g.17309  ORF Transcript_8927/g.17309 Transcript_8927/m.17309 type:complete len:286 (+) Transcript_8927:127-984(+)
MDVADLHSYVFESDEKISSRWAYRAGVSLFGALGMALHGFRIEGTQHVPTKGAALIYGLHTTHNLDVLYFLSSGFRQTRRVVRVLLHQTSHIVSHATKLFGGVVGSREVAVRLLKEGYLVGVIPGGLEETFLHIDSDRTYEVYWDTFWTGKPRAGVAAVALEGGRDVKVLPCFVDGGEEMRWNPFFDLWSLLRLDYAWGKLTRAVPRPVGNVMHYIALAAWLGFSLVSIPVLGRATGYIGKPLLIKEGETVEGLAKQMRDELQLLVDEVRGKNGRARSFSRACGL